MSAVTPDNLLSVTRLLPVPYPTVPVTHVKLFIWTGGPPYDDDDARSLAGLGWRKGRARVCMPGHCLRRRSAIHGRPALLNKLRRPWMNEDQLIPRLCRLHRSSASSSFLTLSKLALYVWGFRGKIGRNWTWILWLRGRQEFYDDGRGISITN